MKYALSLLCFVALCIGLGALVHPTAKPHSVGVTIQPPITTTDDIVTQVELGATQVTFAPGGTAATNVFTSFDSLYSAVGALTGPLNIACDGSHNSSICTVPASTYSFASTRLILSAKDLLTTWTLPTNSFISTLAGINNATVICSGSTSPFALTSSSLLVLQINGASTLKATGSAPCVTLAGAGLTVVYFLDAATLSNSGSTSSVINIIETGTSLYNLYGTGSLAANTVGAPTANKVTVSLGPMFTISSTTQTGILNTGLLPTPTLKTISSIVGYTPTTSSNWAATAPTTILSALDKIAAKMTDAGLQP